MAPFGSFALPGAARFVPGQLPRVIQPSALCATEHARCFRRVRRDGIHQRRRQAVIRFQLQFLESRSDRCHIRGIGAGFNDRGNKRGELRRCPAFVRRKFRMDEIETEERMFFILNTSIHVHAAIFTGVTFDNRVGIDDR
jgi:hypothetical protein